MFSATSTCLSASWSVTRTQAASSGSSGYALRGRKTSRAYQAAASMSRPTLTAGIPVRSAASARDGVLAIRTSCPAAIADHAVGTSG